MKIKYLILQLQLWYITIKKIGDYENTYSIYPLYLRVGKVDKQIEENNGNKCLVSDSTDENKVLKKYTELWDGIENEIEIMNGGKKRWIWWRFYEN